MLIDEDVWPFDDINGTPLPLLSVPTRFTGVSACQTEGERENDAHVCINMNQTSKSSRGSFLDLYARTSSVSKTSKVCDFQKL